MAALAAQAPPPYGAPPGPMPALGQTPVSSYLMGAMILLILGAIAMLVDDFGGAYWHDYYNGIEGRIWINLWSAAGIIIIPVALMMLYMVYWSSQAMRDPNAITIGKLDRWFKVSLVIGALFLVFGLIWATYAIAEDYDDWWLDVGFYGGVIGGFGAAFFFHLAKKQAEQLGYPHGGEQTLVPYPLSSRQPPSK